MFWQGKGTVLRLAVLGLLAPALAALGGCGSSGKAEVSGKVSLGDGTPVPAGTITFWAADNRSAQATLKPDGSYSMGDAPVGDVKVTVETPPPMMSPTGMGKPPPGVKGMPENMLPPGQKELGNVKVVPVPKQYKDQSTTPLTYKVTRGSQKKDFTLTP